MFVPFFDINYLLFSAPAIIVGILATLLLKFWTTKYRQQLNANQLTGIDVAERIARKRNYKLRLNITESFLADNYNPFTQELTLSRQVAQEASITSVGIAAHELGHAEQFYSGNLFFKFRNAIAPMVNISTNIGYYLLLAGILIGIIQLAWVGIILFSAATVFSLITLPIELDASRRGLRMIQQEQLLFANEIPGVRKVLSAAALTYVAGTLQAVGSLAYFFFAINGRSRD